MKAGLYLALICLGVLTMFAEKTNPQSTPPSQLPQVDYVPDERTAIKIAEAVLVPIFGEPEVIGQRPFKARLVEKLWVVSGSVEAPPGHVIFGGVLTVHINKQDGKILDAFQSR